MGGGYLVATIDPVPQPAAQVIAGETDPFWMVWLLVTINASDIAASGARPEAFLAAFDMPRDWPIADLDRLMLGVKKNHARPMVSRTPAATFVKPKNSPP